LSNFRSHVSTLKQGPLQVILTFQLYFSGSTLSEFTSETSGGVSDPAANQRHWNFWKEKLGVPYFSNSTENVVLATIGHTTYLHCLVGNLGDRQVRKSAGAAKP
jgi:hypothetical protein